IVTSTTPKGANPMKFSVILVKIYAIPSLVSKFVTETISPSIPGCSTSIFKLEITADNISTKNASKANKVTAWVVCYQQIQPDLATVEKNLFSSSISS